MARGSVAQRLVEAPRHRDRVSDYVDLEPLTRVAGIRYHPFDKIRESNVLNSLAETRPDWLFVIGLSQLVPAEIRDLAIAGAIGTIAIFALGWLMARLLVPALPPESDLPEASGA